MGDADPRGPLFYLVDATRAGYIGVSEASTAVALILAAVVAALTALAAIALVARGWRLKD